MFTSWRNLVVRMSRGTSTQATGKPVSTATADNTEDQQGNERGERCGSLLNKITTSHRICRSWSPLSARCRQNVARSDSATSITFAKVHGRPKKRFHISESKCRELQCAKADELRCPPTCTRRHSRWVDGNAGQRGVAPLCRTLSVSG